MRDNKFCTALRRYGAILLLSILFVSVVALCFNRSDKDVRPDANDPSIPLFLSASCNFWVDQKGHTVLPEDADAFFSRNPAIAYAVYYCNQNSYLATKLYSEERSVWSVEKSRDIFAHNTAASNVNTILTDELYDIYRHTIISSPPNDEYLSALEIHLTGTTYDWYVGKIREDLADPDKVEPRKTDQIMEFLYLVCLANFTENGIIDNICNDLTPEIPSIPLVMRQDGTWYDQDCNILDESAATSFFTTYVNAADFVNSLNLSANPYLDPDQLPAETLDQMLLFASPNKINNDSDKLCIATLNRMMASPVNVATLQELAQLIQEQSSNDYQNSWHTRTALKIIDELEVKYGDEAQVNACRLYGYNCEDTWLISYVFVNTLARLTESNDF